MSFMRPQKPKIDTAALPVQPQLEDAGRAADQAVRRERQKRGYAAQLLTSGGDQGLGGNLGPIGTAALLGRFG